MTLVIQRGSVRRWICQRTTLAVGRVETGDIPVLTGGVAAPGLYALTGAKQLLETGELPVGNLDSGAGAILARGWMRIWAGWP